MTLACDVTILFANGSSSRVSFDAYPRAFDYCRNQISYSGRRVQRVEIVEGTSTRAIWDASWDDASKLAGLKESLR